LGDQHAGNEVVTGLKQRGGGKRRTWQKEVVASGNWWVGHLALTKLASGGEGGILPKKGRAVEFIV